MRVGVGFAGSDVSVLRSIGLEAGVTDNAIQTGADGRRCRQASGVGLGVAHELSCQKAGRRGSGRGSAPRVIIAPPQQGQRSSGDGMRA